MQYTMLPSLEVLKIAIMSLWLIMLRFFEGFPLPRIIRQDTW